jgi:protein-L-isoaspartate(D-aspartate) O-methyltransferase
MDRYIKLINELVAQKYLVSPHIIKAFKQVPREKFLPKSHKWLDALNCPLPIGKGQTISQPLTVAFMVQMLNPRPGQKILEIGYGSGWQTAILLDIVCPNTSKKCGFVYAYEIIPEIAVFGKQNLSSFLQPQQKKHLILREHDYLNSFNEHAPYDRIIAAAAFSNNPTKLIKSLSIRGIFVYPTMADDIRKITRTGKNSYTEDVFPGFVFVPITHGQRKQ